MCDCIDKVLIISHFSGGEKEQSNDRFKYITHMLSKSYSVNLITSAFIHTQKKHSNIKEEKTDNYIIKYIDEPGYKTNICLKRFYSHFICGRNLKKYLKNEKKPKVIYCAIPSLSVALTAIKYAKKNKIPIILDIQDLWPEAFKMVFNPPIIGKYIYNPIKRIADYIYKNATEIVAVSNTYCERAKEIDNKKRIYESIYIGTSFEKFDKIQNLYKDREEKTYYLIYIGTLGNSYDLKCAISAYQIVKKKMTNDKQIKFWVIGDGPLQKEFEKFSLEKGLDVEFKGRLAYQEMVGYLKAADIAINPIVGKSAASIINKHADYAAAGLPVISTQRSNEYKKILYDYSAGFTCENGDFIAMADKITYLLENDEIRIRMSKNSRKMGEELFNRDKTYIRIEEIIKTLIQ